MSEPIHTPGQTPPGTAVELLQSMRPAGVSERRRAFAQLLTAVTSRTTS